MSADIAWNPWSLACSCSYNTFHSFPLLISFQTGCFQLNWIESFGSFFWYPGMIIMNYFYFNVKSFSQVNSQKMWMNDYMNKWYVSQFFSFKLSVWFGWILTQLRFINVCYNREITKWERRHTIELIKEILAPNLCLVFRILIEWLHHLSLRLVFVLIS